MKTFKNITKRGFTLVELIVVIAIIAILAAVSVAGYFGFIEMAKSSASNQEAQSYKIAIIAETTNVYSVPFEVADSTSNNKVTTSSKISNTYSGVKISGVTGTFTSELAAKLLVLLIEDANTSTALTAFPYTNFAFASQIPETVTKKTIVVTDSQIISSQNIITSFYYVSEDSIVSEEMLLH